MKLITINGGRRFWLTVCLALATIVAQARFLSAANRPKLMVVVSVDQLAYEYLERFEKGFSQQGIFARFRSQGAWFTDCHHRHAFTITGPGHSVMLTGAYPNANGIVANSWRDRESGKNVYCVTDPDSPLLGGQGTGVSPRNLLTPTVGDLLRQTTDQRAQVFGVAIKDRSAVLMTGRGANAAYWFDSATGNFISSRYYHQRLPNFLRRFNESDEAERFSGATWNLLHDPSRYKLHRPDDYRYEGEAYGIGRSFPHQLTTAEQPQYYQQLTVTPFGNELLIQVARQIIVHNRLGLDDTPDLLAIGMSANDPLGHNFGPYSLEVEDMTYRTDLLLGQFARWLDQQVGQGEWTMALTADHGVAPIPEYAASIGLPGKRNPLGSLKQLRQKLENELVKKLGSVPAGAQRVELVEANQVYLRKGTSDHAAGDFSTAQSIVRDILLKHPAIAMAVTRDELLCPKGNNDPLFQQLHRLFHRRRSGDVLFVLKPYQIQSASPATHGSPWPYDTHVPLLLLGAGIRHGRFDTATSPAAVAPTVAKLLGVEAPETCVEQPLCEALESGRE